MKTETTTKKKSENSIKHIESKGACGLHCIKINDFTVRIGEQTIIEDVDLHIHCGKLTAIIGKNGAGKSTLIKAINGEIKHEGQIVFTDIKNNKVQNLKIGYVPQFLNISKNTPVSVYDLMASYISRFPVFLSVRKKLREDIYNHLKKFNIENLIDKMVCDLSGGELQRVLLSLATKPVPNLLLLDEPVSGIDHNGMELFYKTISKLKKDYDMSIILVSHDLEYVAKYADNVVLLDKKILKSGKPGKVFASKEFKKIFGNVQAAGKE